jgi:hypothetical protein
MKFYSLLLFFVLFSSLYSQQNSVTALWVEIFFGAENVPPGYHEIELTFEPQGTVWGIDDNSRFYIDPTFRTINYCLTTFNDPIGSWNGFDRVNSISPDSKGVFGYGLYKGSVNGISFYIDYRDDNYGRYMKPVIGSTSDIWIKFDYANNKLYLTSSPSYCEWLEVTNESYFRIWNLKGKVQSTDEFEPYSPVNLSVNEKDENYPILNWEHRFPADDYWNGYRIYRCITTYFDDIPTDYIPIATVGRDVTTYSDTQVQFGNWNFAHYRVKTVNSNIESGFSNDAGASLIALLNKKGKNADNAATGKIISYGVQQNYPNPFNPVTQISYSVRDNNLVSMQVFDVLGNKAADLVNEIKPAGEYSVTFDGSNLPSGIYIYKYKCGNYLETRKMILVK